MQLPPAKARTPAASSGWVSPSCSTPVRGRRQLPQTPLTPRPGVAYKTANSSPAHLVSGPAPPSSLSPGRLSRGLSEHVALLRHSGSHFFPCPVTRICSEPFLGGGRHRTEVSPYSSLREQLDVFPSAGHSPVRTSVPCSSPSPQQQQRLGVPNGYHLSFGGRTSPSSSSSPGGPRAARYYEEADEDEWC